MSVRTEHQEPDRYGDAVDGSGPDVGLTHVALAARDAEDSIGFYARYGDLVPVHRREDPTTGANVVWLSDGNHPFVVVLIEAPVSHRLGGLAHVGVGCADRETVDRRCAAARAAGLDVLGPLDDGPPVGYWAIIPDPDGHQLELSVGQDVAGVVARQRDGDPKP